MRPGPSLLLACVMVLSPTGCWWRCGSFAGTWPLDVDLDSIRNLAIPEDVKSIAPWFPWMKVARSEGERRSTKPGTAPPPAGDGIVDRLTDDAKNRAGIRPRTTSMFIRATLHVGLDAARSGFDIECKELHEDYFEQRAV